MGCSGGASGSSKVTPAAPTAHEPLTPSAPTSSRSLHGFPAEDGGPAAMEFAMCAAAKNPTAPVTKQREPPAALQPRAPEGPLRDSGGGVETVTHGTPQDGFLFFFMDLQQRTGSKGGFRIPLVRNGTEAQEGRVNTGEAKGGRQAEGRGGADVTGGSEGHPCLLRRSLRVRKRRRSCPARLRSTTCTPAGRASGAGRDPLGGQNQRSPDGHEMP